MKIGAAVTTYNRKAHIEYWKDSMEKYTPSEIPYYIAVDTDKDRRYVARRKNECLKVLYDYGCDYFFLFDDDTFVLKEGWEIFFIDALIASGQNHFIYTHEHPNNRRIESVNGIGRYQNCNGCLMVFTRKAIETVGGFNTEYKYGYEHADVSNRIHAAGLNSMGAYLCPDGAAEYIFSCDIDCTKPDLIKKLKHNTSMSAQEAIGVHLAKSEQIYKQPSQIFYPL